MARIRQLKPEIWIDERVRDLPRDSRLLYVGLITQADDEGRQDGRPTVVRSLTCPADDVSAAQVTEWIDEIVAAGLAVRYGDRPFLWLPKFTKHQYIQRPKPSALPEPPCPVPADEDPPGEGDPAATAHDDTASDTRTTHPSDTDIGQRSDPPRGRVDFLSSKGTTSPSPLPPTGGKERTRRPSIDGTLATEAELALAEAVFAEFNRQRQLGEPRLRDLAYGKETRNRVIRCIRTAPDLDLAGHAAVIAARLADPYWTGHPGPEHLYRPDLFGQALALVEAPPPARAPLVPLSGGVARAAAVSHMIDALTNGNGQQLTPQAERLLEEAS